MFSESTPFLKLSRGTRDHLFPGGVMPSVCLSLPCGLSAQASEEAYLIIYNLGYSSKGNSRRNTTIGLFVCLFTVAFFFRALPVSTKTASVLVYWGHFRHIQREILGYSAVPIYTMGVIFFCYVETEIGAGW